MGANKHRPHSGKLKQDFEDPPSPRGPHGEGGAGVPGGGWDPCRREPRACPVLNSHSVFRNGPPATQDTMRTADRTLLACCRLGERSG